MPKKIRHTALDLLARRDHAPHELKQKLIKRGYVIEEINQLITDLINQGLLNEQRFVENYVHFRCKKGYGPERIYLELKARGIAPDKINTQLDYADNIWFLQAQHTWRKRYKGRIPKDWAERMKQVRFLHYRGFTEEHIEKVFTDLE